MKTRFAIACLVVAFSTSAAIADWRELKNGQNCAVEVAIDFSIENLRIDPSGSTSFSAKTIIDGDQLGFSVSLSKAQDGKMGVLFEKDELSVMRSDLDIRSIGPATDCLERRLNKVLGVEAGGGGEGAYHAVGLYSAISPPMASAISQVALFDGLSVGCTYDRSGSRIAGDCFSVRLVVDGPLNRLTAYFHIPGGYGGTAEADRARSRWNQEKSQVNKRPEGTAGKSSPSKPSQVPGVPHP
jgi:hypothetical protein